MIPIANYEASVLEQLAVEKLSLSYERCVVEKFSLSYERCVVEKL